MAGLLASVRSRIARSIVNAAALSTRDGWGGVVLHEPYTGAWQLNDETRVSTSLAHPAVFACTSLISSDIGKVRLRLVTQDTDGIWTETTSAAFSPVLKKPNRFQRINTFLETWVISKLTHGNTYVLKQRDNRGVVVAMYVLDPTRVIPLVTPSGDVYYQLYADDLLGVPSDPPPVVPESEIIHDLINPIFHQMIGVSPIFACGIAALQGTNIVANATKFFANGSRPSGILLAPLRVSDEAAVKMKETWQAAYSGDNVGKVAVLGDNLKYQALSVNAADAQLIEQLKWTTETICSCYHVPAPLIDSSIQAPYGNNTEPLLQLYYSQCLQTLMNGIELSLDDGLALPAPYGTEFDVDDLIWFDTATRTKAAGETIRSGALSPDEARKKYFGLGKVKGGDTPYLQQQMFSLAALAERDQNDPFAKPAPAAPAIPAPESNPEGDDTAAFLAALHAKAIEAGLIHAS
jgi:HK97 family phage portal protein